MFISLSIIFVIIIIIPFIYLFSYFKIFIFKQFFKIPTSNFNFQSQKFHYSRSFIQELFSLLLLLFHLFIYLFLKIPPLNNFSKFPLPNLISDFKYSTIHIHSFKYYFRYYYYYSIYLFI